MPMKYKPVKTPVTSSGKEARLEQKDLRSKQAALNKQRSRTMENAVAKYFGGNRVPLSGASRSWKGDVIVPLICDSIVQGNLLIECKYREKAIRIDTLWFPKIDNEVYVTRSVFGILLWRYSLDTTYYVAVTDSNMQLLIQYLKKVSTTTAQLVEEVYVNRVIDTSLVKENKVNYSTSVSKSLVEDLLTKRGLPFTYAWVNISGHDVMLCRGDVMRSIITLAYDS